MRLRRRRVWSAAGLIAVLLLLARLPTQDEPVRARHAAGDPAPAPASAQAEPPATVSRMLLQTYAAATPPAPLPAATPAPAVAAVRLNVIAPQKLQVGETNELVVSVGPNNGIGEMAFTVQFDANVLQVRAASDGSWTAGAAHARFAADIAGTEDRVQIRSGVAGRHVASGIAAIVEFQAVAPGSTRVMVSDVTVKDSAGRAIAFVLSASSLPVTVESLPPPAP